MKTKVLEWVLVAAIGGALCPAAQASEYEEAKAACERVSPLWIAEHQRNGQKVAPMDCHLFREPPAYWQCMEEKMTGGNPWRYAEAQCNEERNRRSGRQEGAQM